MRNRRIATTISTRMNGLVGQYRPGDQMPHEAKMWAQLSPSDGIVHEVLPGDLDHSPSLPDASTSRSPNRRTMNIRDTIGLGEMLVNAVNATRFRHAQPREWSWHQWKAIGMANRCSPQRQQSDQQEFQSRRQVNIHLGVVQPPSQCLPLRHQIRHPSPSTTSDSYSPQTSPRLVGSPHDLESFQDLFVRPNVSAEQCASHAERGRAAREPTTATAHATHGKAASRTSRAS